MNIEELRQEIDSTDQKLINALAERFKLTQQIGEIKKQNGTAVRDPAREKILLDKISKLAEAQGLEPEVAFVPKTCRSCDTPFVDGWVFE